jgi:hypothetical protein
MLLTLIVIILGLMILSLPDGKDLEMSKSFVDQVHLAVS